MYNKNISKYNHQSHTVSCSMLFANKRGKVTFRSVAFLELLTKGHSITTKFPLPMELKVK